MHSKICVPLDVLKLDKEFFGAYDESTGREQKIIHHIISMAKDLEITVLAEGVETEQQKEFLKALHCDMIQGYYYAKPMSVSEFEKFVGARPYGNMKAIIDRVISEME